jgi:phosphopantothenoylcysteine synthetase/decarboxylase
MRILVTAGNTLAPIDRVRCLTNIFTGRTGAQIALEAQGRGHDVTLLTSHPDVVAELTFGKVPQDVGWAAHQYQTFAELHGLMEAATRADKLDAVVHSAAVSDYLPAGVYAPGPFTRFRDDAHWESSTPELPALVDRRAGKVKSDEPELWLRLVRAPKLVDMIRAPWGFRGILVKFKLEVGVSEERLLEIAERSRVHSHADLMVANTLEGAASWAYLGPRQGRYARIARNELAKQIIDAVEQLHGERPHG